MHLHFSADYYALIGLFHQLEGYALSGVLPEPCSNERSTSRIGEESAAAGDGLVLQIGSFDFSRGVVQPCDLG